MFSFVPEARHFKTWFLGDYQDPEDLYSGIKKQGNLTIIRRGSRNILGENFKWLFDKVEHDRINLARRVYRRTYIENIAQLRAIENKFKKLKRYLDQRRPYVDELPDNKAYVTWQNQEIKLVTVELPSFHHRQSTEDFLLDTGLTWSVNKNKKPKDTDTITKSEKKQSAVIKKKIKEDILRRMEYWREVEKKSWDTIKDELVALQSEGIIHDLGFESKDGKYFSNWYTNWKKKQALVYA